MPENKLDRREFISRAAAVALGTGLCGAPLLQTACSAPREEAVQSARNPDRPPNFVVIFADDMGFGDWEYGGHPTIRTPNLERMAREGARLTSFYTGAPVCSPSRSALLTGRNHIRTGVLWVFFPRDSVGMSPEEVTIAECLKPRGYSTACIGKWHLGDDYDYRPLRQGFDYYYGILYSNDMKNADLWRNDENIEAPADQTTLTRRYTEEAVKFIRENRDNPFFLYLPHTFPHIPLHASEQFRGTSLRGLYGDVIEELDWSVGRILDTLDSLDLAEDTLVIFTSDNGPWWTMKLNGGSHGPLRGAKGDTWEGGMRVPMVARWPGRIPSGLVTAEVASVVDFLPTFAGLAGATVPDGRPIDGIDMMPVLEGGAAPADRCVYFYQCRHTDRISAIRQGPWKLHLRIFRPELGGYSRAESWVELETPQLYNLDLDPGERFDVAAENPQVVEKLAGLASDYQAEIDRLDENRDLKDFFLND